VRELKNGDAPLVRSRNREVVTALREIAAGKLVVVPKPFEKGKPEELNEEMEANSAPALTSEEELKQAAEGPEADAVRDQRQVENEEAIVLGQVFVETPTETSY